MTVLLHIRHNKSSRFSNSEQLDVTRSSSCSLVGVAVAVAIHEKTGKVAGALTPSQVTHRHRRESSF